MDAVIYTKDDTEYNRLSTALQEESELMDVYRDPLDGHGHFDYAYDMVVVALEGAQGMETVLEWSRRYPDTQIIWITSDRYFAGMATRQHIHDFILRPYQVEQIRSI